MLKKILIAFVVIILAIGATIGYAALPVRHAKEPTATVIDKTGTQPLVVGIISDSQLGQSEEFVAYTEKAVALLKEKGVDLILNMGDITDTATKKNYAPYADALNKVYGDTKPLMQSIMGNHDYWLPMFFDCWEIPFQGTLQRRFLKATEEESPWTHKIVNGYHFIGASPTNGGMDEAAYAKNIEWIKAQIELAVKDDPTKPIFVLTHSNPQDTVYMSEGEGGCKNLNELFTQYPQVVSFSGHSHAPLMDEEAIFQKDYTAISTQCLSYVCFAENEIDLVQEDSSFISEVPMLMIMELDNNNITINRYNVLSGEAQDTPWKINYPLIKENFTYTDEKRSASAVVPTWPASFTTGITQGKDKDNKVTNLLTFTSAIHPTAVKYYTVSFKDATGQTVALKDKDGKSKENLLFVSDFARATKDRATTASFTLPNSYQSSLPAGTYTATLTARSAFSTDSESKTFSVELKW